MESTMSTEDLKGRLDRNESIKVVETLAPERYREAHLPGAVNIPRRRDANSKVAERAISPFLTKSVSQGLWIWGGRRELNPQPSEPQSDALPS